MKRNILHATEQIDAVCEYRYNQFVQREMGVSLHSHDYYELIFLESNAQKHYVNGSVFDLPKNTLIFIRPDDCHDLYDEQNTESVIQHLAFTQNMAESVFAYLGSFFPSSSMLAAKFPPYVILDSSGVKLLKNLLYSLNIIGFDDRQAKNIAMRSVLVQIFAGFFYTHKEKPRRDTPLWLSNVCSAMSNIKNFSEGLPKMAELSGRTKEHLCRSMKKYYGVTASEFINDIRLTYIANRLVNSDVPIIDLCYESGFSNLGWMYTLFKQKYGISPAVFRQNKR